MSGQGMARHSTGYVWGLEGDKSQDSGGGKPVVEGDIHPILQLPLLPLQDVLQLHGLHLEMIGLSLHFPVETILLEVQVVA